MKQYYPEEYFSSKRGFATKLFCIAFVLFFGTFTLKAQNCTVNAGILNETICETDVLTLQGNVPSPIIGSAQWSQVSGPSVNIVSPNSVNTVVTGYTGGNTYVFRYSATCGDGIYTYQDKTVVVMPITIADAGTNIASCPNSSGSLVITGNAPENAGETGQWSVVGSNNAGVVINFPDSPTSTIILPQTNCGTTTLRWTITGTEYAPGQFCETFSDITVTNYGGQTPISAGPDQTLGNCYTTTQSTNLEGSFGGCGLNGQSGTWGFVSGPNTPTISNSGSNNTSVNNLIEGTYVFRWTVTGPCVSGSDDVSITVPAATQDVTTLSGGDENIYFCDNTITQVTLEAQTPLYAGEMVEWTQTGGDPGAVIESPNNPTTLVTNISDSGDPYTFRYTLTNSVTGCVFTKDYIVQFSGPTRTIEANGGNNIHGACNETDFSIPLVTTGNGVNRYRIESGPAASPLGPFPTSPSNVGSTLNISLTVAGTYIIQFARVPNGDLPVGCDYGFDTITIVVSGDPTPSNAGSNISLDCGVTSTQLAGVPPVVGISAWTQVSGPNQATITDNFDPETTVTGLVSGTYVFQYITKGEGARCGFSTANVEVYVSSSTLTPPDAGANDTICIEGTVTLSANPPQAGEYGEWSQISGPDVITFSDINDPNAVASGFASASSAYVLRWTIGYSNPGSSGCSAPVFDDVEISTDTNNAPTTAVAGPDTCYPSGTTDVTLSANDPTVFGIAFEEGTWSVSPGAGITFDDVNDPNTTAHNIPSDGTYTFTWTIQRIIAVCDASTDDMVITIADAPLADAGPDQEVCDDTVIMAATLSSGAQGTWTRVSGPGSYTISNENDPNATFTFTYSGFYTFRWTVDAEVCTTNFDDVNLTVNVPVGTVDAGPDQNICAGDSTVLAGSSYDSFFETGEWSLLAGAPNVPTLSDSSDPNTSVTGLVAGTYTFTWTISSKDYFLCPPVTDTMVIEVSPPADAGDDATYCDVTSVQLVGNDNSTGTWTQISGPASTITQSPANSYVANATVIPGNTYVFQYETDTFNFTTGGTCPGSTDTVQVEIFSGASVDPNAGPDQKLCIDDVGRTATMAGNAPPGDVTLAEWRWIYQPAGSVAVIDNPADENTTISNLTVEGLYILEWVFESASCRSLSDIVRINMYAAPSTADAGPDDTVACQQTYQTNAVAPTVGIGTWSFANPGDDPSGGDVVIDNPNNPVTTLSNITTLGTYVLTWTVTNGPFTNPSLCEPSTDTVSITFNDDPPTQAEAGPDQELCAVTQTNMAATPLTSGLGTWTQTLGPNTANIASPNDPATLIFGMITGTYEFTWKATTANDDGCSSQDTIQVIIYEAPSTANAGPDQQIAQFSPVVMAATAPTVGTGRWSQVSGPTTVGFTSDISPTTNITGTVAGTYVLQWNVNNGNCAASIDQVIIEIVALADLELSKSVLPTTGNAGEVVTFSIEVFNNDGLGGSVDATGVSVKDIIPSGYTLVPGTANNGGVYNLGDNSLTWSGLTILNGDTITLTFDATINATGSYVNTAQVTASDQIDPDSTPNNDDGDQSEDDEDNATINVEVADLSLQKSVTPGIVSVGENVVFTIQVDNAGPYNATGVTVSEELPSGYTYVSDNGGGAYNSATGIWTIGTINNGASASLEITATVTAIANYINTAEVETADQSDPDSTPGNGLTEDDLDTATINLQQADLELVKNASSVLVNEGDTVTFTLTLSNNGPGDATGIEVEDYLPNGYTLVPGSVSNGGLYQIANSTISWTALSLANGGVLNLTFDAIAIAGGSHFNTAQITASDLPDPDSTPDNDDGDQSEDDESGIDVNIIIVTPTADLSLTKNVVAGNITPIVGTQVSFELIITNDGPDNATGVQVNDLLPSGYDFVNFSSSAGLYNENTGLWNVGTVDSGTSESLIIDAKVLATGDYFNIAEVTASDLPDPDSTPNNDDGDQSEDDEDNAFVTPVGPSADLSVTKTVNNTTPLVSSQVTFEVVIANNGPQTATGIQVTDLLPDGYTYNSFSATTGTYNSTTGLWNVGTLAISESETLLVTATVNATDDYENIVEVTASDLPDPDSTPNNAVDTEDDYASISTTPIATAADLSITKTVNNATPLVGSQVTFEVIITNDGPQTATSVQVMDLLPDGYTYNSFSATTGTYNSTTGLWNISILERGNSETLIVTATVNATGDYENIAEVTASDLPDPDSTPNNAVDTEDDYASVTTTPIATAADLSVTKMVNNATPLVGTNITFTVTVSNDGPQDATGVTVTDLLPTGYTFVSSNATTGAYNDATGLWTVGSIANGSFETLQVTATVNATGDYENIAEVTASNLPDPDSTPNNAVDSEDDYASVITTPIGTAADLSITKTVNSATPLVGSQVTFEVVVTNDGPQTATGIQVTDLLPDGYTYNSFSATTGTYNSTTGLWNIGTLAIGESETLLVTATVNATGDYENIAEVTASNLPDPDSTPNNAVDTEDDYASVTTTPIATAADLSVTKTVNNATPLVGTNITFTVTVSNDGPQDATGVTVTDLLPSGYTFVSSTATTGAYNDATGLWTVGSITTGSFETLQVTATVNATGDYENIAEVTASDLPDPDSTPNNAVDTEDDYASATTTPIAESADLSLTKTVNNATPLVGTNITFTITVSNDGPQDATGVTVTDLLPSGYTFVSSTATTGAYNDATGLWTVGSITTGSFETLQVTATVNATGDYLNIAEVTASDLPDPDSTPANGLDTEDDYASVTTIPIATAADLSITKTVNNATPLVGSQVTFEVVITNDGPQTATGVQVTDLLPDGYTYNSFSATTGTYNSTTGLWNVGTLANGESETLLVTVTVNATGDYENIAEVTASDLPDLDSTPNNAVDTEDDYASITTAPVVQSADLSLTKTVNNATPLVGSQVTFTVMVSNDGPQNTSGVTVTDLLPNGYTYVSYTTTAGAYDSGTGLWTVGNLDSGIFHTLQVMAIVNGSGDYTNIAEVTASNLTDPDSTPANGIDTEDDYASVSTVPIPISADLSIIKTVNHPTPLVGSGVVFTIIVTNDGPQDATGVQVDDLLPSGYSFIVATTTSGVYNNLTGIWEVGTVASGISETLLVNASVLPSGDYLNIAEITASDTPDPDSTPGNGIDTEDDYASVATVPIAVSADLSITKTVNNPTPLVGSGVIFEIIVTNDGPQTATGVVVTDLLPSGYTFVVATTTGGIYNSTTGEWVVGTMPSGTSETLLINGIVQPTGDYFNIAEITSSNEPDPDSTPGNGIDTEDDYASVATAPIAVSADLSITKTVNNPTPLVGSGVIFEITITNDGPQTATGVEVTDLLPSGYTFVVATTTGGIYNSAIGEWSVGTLTAGTSETLLINAIVQPAGDYLNIAEITSSNEPDPDSTPGNGIDTEDDYASVATAPIAVFADLSLTKTVNNPTPIIGGGVTFEIIVTNDGPQTATGVVVTDLLPSGYSYVIASSTDGVYNSNTGEWLVSALPAGASQTLLINATVQSTGDYLNVAEITSSNEADPDSTPDNGIDTEDDYATAITTPIIPTADLELTKTIVGGNATPLVGSQIIFNIEVSNAGPSSATGVVIEDVLPSGYTFVSYNATEGIYNSVTGLWTIGDPLISGASISLQITAVVNSTGDYLNTAEIFSSDVLDPDSTPNNGVTTEDDYGSVSTTPIPLVADLSLTKAVNNTTPLVGSQVTFEVVITNDGPQTTTGVQVTDLLPDGYMYNSFSATSGTYNSTTGLWNVGTLAIGESETLLVTATVNATGDYLNIAEVTASNLPDPDSTPNNAVDTEDDYASVITTPIATAADLSITKTVNNATPLVGTQVTFEVVITNDGPQTATGVQVTDLLPDGYAYNSFSATTGTYNSTTGLWNIGTLANGESETLLVTATVNATGDYENIAEVTASNLPDPDSTPNNSVDTEDDYASATTTPIAISADLSVTKTVNNATPLVGSNITFTVAVSNDGPQDATGVTVTDLLPTGYTFVSSTATTGAYNDATGLWTVGSITTGSFETLQVTAAVNATGDYENIAEVTASDLPDSDSTPANGIDIEDDYASATTTPIAESADLSVTKTVNSATPLVGSQVTFEVVVSNDGPQTGTGVQITDLLPDGYTYNSFSATTGTYNSTTGLWNVGTLAIGESETLLVTATVNATGDYLNIAEVTASDLPDPDSTPANVIDTEDDYASVSTTPIATAADLSITKTVNNATPLVGSQVTFEVVITNDGPQTGTGVQITDLLPDGYTYNSFSATTGTYNSTTGLWNVGTLANGESETLLVMATVNATGDYENIAEVTASNLPDPDSTPANGIDSEDDYASAITMPVVQVADLSITKTVNNTTPLIGSQVTFQVIITNDGPQTATGVQLADLLPDGYTYSSFSATTGTYNSTTGLWNVGTLTNGESETLLVTATVNATGDYLNIAEVTASNLPDPDSTPNNDDGDQSEDDEASVSVTPATVFADLSITKNTIGGNTLYNVGALVVFEVTVINDGPGVATGVVVEDLLPQGFSFLSYTATSGVYNSATGVWSTGAVLSGGSQTLLVYSTVNVPTGNAGEYTNTAEIIQSDVSDPDSTPGNGVITEDDFASLDIIVEMADLSLEKTVSNITANVGETIVFTIQINNDGPTIATGVAVEDIVPVGYYEIGNISGGGIFNGYKITWQGLTVPLGGVPLTYEATVYDPTGLTDEDYKNIAQITASDQFDIDSTPNNDDGDQSEDDEDASFIEVPRTDIGITKAVDNAEPAMNTLVNFTITAENLSALETTNLIVSDALPNGYEFDSYTASTGDYNSLTGVWSISQIAGNSLETLVIRAKVVDNSNYLNIARLESLDQVDYNPDNDEGSASVSPTCLNIYNEFSPNGDGDNDYFYIDCIANYPNNVLRIYSRWGDEVFSAKGYDNTWRGTSDGPEKTLPVGTYFYILDLGDGSEKIQGWLYLKR